MNRIKYNLVLLSVFALFIVPTIQAQNSPQTENWNIRQFIQVWGLVKYRSQKSISGQFDADQVFLDMLNTVKNADKNQMDELMLELSRDSGPKPTVSKQVYRKDKLINGPYLLENIDFRWIRSKQFSPLLKKQLTDLTNQINTSGKHQYVPSVFYLGDVPNERAYKNYTFDQEDMNLLALAKAWNAIEYLFPYAYVMDRNWQKLLAEMIPVFREIQDRTGYEKAILMLETATNDTHAGVFLSPNNIRMSNEIFDVKYYPPFDYVARETGLVITQFLTDSLANQSSLQIGDEIVEINGIKTKKWLKDRSSLLPASNAAVLYRELSTTHNNRADAFAFSQVQNPILELKVKRDGVLQTHSLELLILKDKPSINLIVEHIMQQRIDEKALKGIENIGTDITLIRAGAMYDQDLPEDELLEKLSTELKSKKALLFDMRKYPQSPGFFSYYIPKLLGKEPFAFARYYTADLRQIGVFRYKKELETYMNVPTGEDYPIGELYQGQIVILTNEHTQSMGEWYTMMLRQFNENTTVIGSQTAGADGDVRRITLPGDYQFSFTGNGIFYPDGEETQRIGIVPDIHFKPTLQELIGTEDAHLQRALRFIREGK